jgi:regulator of sigma E protease
MLLIVLGFGLLIGIHELGHFIAAKWSGIRTNAFAIGMGPQVVSYRGGVGFCYKGSASKVIEKFGKDANDMSDAELQEHGLSETEYSLRLLPIGGFVSMLGQEDGKPDSVSEDPRSYNRCSIGKRMVVVSAGVVMNVLLACFLFLVCFQVGVNFEAPILGAMFPNSPAANATAVGLDSVHLQPGDQVVTVNGEPAKTFTDISLASAMAKPGVPVVLEVQREGHDSLLTFSIMPASVTQEGLLELGLLPASSATLRSGEQGVEVMSVLHVDPSFLPLEQGMTMREANGEPIEVWAQYEALVKASDGEPISTQWEGVQGTVSVEVPVQIALSIIRVPDVPENAPQNFERGLLGMCPLTKIGSVLESSPNKGVLLSGDVLLKAGSLEAPRMGQLRNYLSNVPDGTIHFKVIRDGVKQDIDGTIHNGLLGVMLVQALEVPMIAQPIQQQLIDGKKVPTPLADWQILAGSTIEYVQGEVVLNWEEFRSALVNSGEFVSISLKIPTKDSSIHEIDFRLSSEEQLTIANTGWTSPLSMGMFDPIFVTRSSGGNPLKALQMGFAETVSMVEMTYVTLDRLFRRSVGVDQLRGPVGIVHIGSKIADRGYCYLFFFLGIISINLAVLNFLPLPIVDGGLFLFLIYEKLFKKPPSIAFQNAAAVLGLSLIGMLFVVTFYNDIMRIVG